MSLHNGFAVTCLSENEDGSADIEIEIDTNFRGRVIEEGINFLLMKAVLEGTTEDILRWAELGKQEERTDSLVKKFNEIYTEDTK